jgi:hypothetical protein
VAWNSLTHIPQGGIWPQEYIQQNGRCRNIHFRVSCSAKTQECILFLKRMELKDLNVRSKTVKLEENIGSFLPLTLVMAMMFLSGC